MNLRCIYCQTPFTLARAEMLNAIVSMNDKNMNHYDAHCPRCRRANSISRQRMELFYPNWQEAAKQQAAMPAPPPLAAVAAAPAPSATASAALKTEPLPRALKAGAARKPEAKKPAVKTAKKAASAASKAKKTVVKRSKPAAKATSKGKKAPVKGKKKK
jgi:hypothetical protein